MGGKVVHHVVNGLGHGESFRMTFKNIEKGLCGVIGAALEIHLSVSVMKKGKDVQRAVSDIFEFLEALLHGVGLQVGHQAIEDLNARALVEKEQQRRRVTIEFDEVFHFWKEVGVCDVKKVARLPVDPMKGCQSRIASWKNIQPGGKNDRNSLSRAE